MLKKLLLFAVFAIFINTTASAQYCTPSSTDPNFFIQSFSTTGAPVNISNLNSGFSIGGYGDFTGMAVTQVVGGTINFSVVSGNGAMRPNIWVDWNNDFDFDDAGEEVFNAGPGNVTTTGSFVIPGGTPNGSYRMRLRADRNAANVASCGFDDRSEAEDYTLIVGTPPNCTTPPDQATALVFGTITGSSISGSFTAATADSYLVLVNTTGTVPTAPTNGTTYAIGDTSLGATVVDNDSDLSFTATGLTASTQYYFFIYSFNNTNCINGPMYNTTGPLTGDDTTTSVTYCVPSSTNNTHYIDLFETTGGVTNFSNAASGYTAGGYADNSSTLIASQIAGQDITFNSDFETNAVGASVWIDLNNDGDFDDPDEELFNSNSFITGLTLTYSIPASLPVGTYRIRIIIDDLDTTPEACTLSSTGEAEDYTLEVLPLPCGDDPSNIVISAITGTSATVSWTAATPIPGTGYEYLVTTNINTPNFNLPGTGTTNNTTTSVNVTGLSDGVTYYVWVRSICGGGNGSGQWIGPETFITPAIPPTTTNVTICSGEASQDLTANASCSATINLGASITGALDAATDPVANRLATVITSGSPCNFVGATSNYDTVEFTVDVTGTYIFAIQTPAPYFDAMGYIFETASAFVPGTCSAGYIGGDDDSGPALDPQITADLTAGVTYTLVTLKWATSSTTHTGPYTWNISGPGSLFGGSGGYIEWYTTATGGTPIGTGSNFDPVGVAGSGLADTNTAGTYSYWAACSGSPSVRTQADFTINQSPQALIDGRGSICDASVTLEVYFAGIPPYDFTYTNGTTPVTVTNYSGPFPYTFSVVPNASDTYVLTALSDASGCPAPAANLTGSVSFTGDKDWNGSVSTDWNDPNNWTPVGVPTDADAIVIPNVANNPTVNSTVDGAGCSLTIQSGATLTQLPNSSLTINKDVFVEAGATYTMQNGASLIQIDNVANTVDGTFTMDRTANIRENDYVYWSSPVTTFNVESISTATPTTYLYQWNPSFDRPNGPPPDNVPNDFGRWEAASGTMTPSKGYAVKGPTGHTATASDFTATFSGVPNNGDITINIDRGTYVGVPYGGPGDTNVTADDDNWNFIGNPYPSSINAIDFLTLPANSNIDGNVYLWTHGTDLGTGNTDPFYEDYAYNYNIADYIAYNSSGVSTPLGFNGYIGAGQGFFVLMTDSGGTTESITFNNTMRNNAYDNNQFYRSTSTSDINTTNETSKIWLDLITPSGTTNTTLVAYVDGATNDEDRMYDAKNANGNGLDLYSIIDNKAYIIQGRQLPFTDSDLVPIGVNINETGIHTLAINTLNGLFTNAEQDIYIEDLSNGTIHNIKESPYTFSSEQGIINDRFVLRYTNNALNINDYDAFANIKVFEYNEELIVKSTSENIQSIEVFDILGRQLFINQTVNAEHFVVKTIQKSESTLFLKVKLVDGKQKIAKIIF